jgi:phosphatidylglycerol:prolipoprotein diacylglycerol transferase
MVRLKYGVYDTLLYSGLHAGGAIVGIIVGAPLVLRALRLPALRTLDAAVPGIALGIAVARIGCFLEGCCFGVRCRAAWCIQYPVDTQAWHRHAVLHQIPAGAGWSAPVHPLPLYFSAAALCIAAVCLWLHPRRGYEGQVALVGVALFAGSSAALEPLRENGVLRAIGPWGIPQLTWFALILLGATLAAMLAIEFGGRRRHLAPARGT